MLEVFLGNPGRNIIYHVADGEERALIVSRRRALKAMGASAVLLLLVSRPYSPAHAVSKPSRRVSCKIVYKLNGGVNPKGQIGRVSRGEWVPTSRLKKPERANYDFCGWYSDKELTKKAKRVWGLPDAAKRRVYARWEPSLYKISYKLSGGENPKDQVLTVRRNKVLASSKLKKPSRRGYAFDGWYKDPEFLYPTSKVAGKLEVDGRRVYAKWRLKNYKIAYKLKGGKEVVSLPKSYNVKSAAIKPARPVRDGFYFDGWFEDSSFEMARQKIKTGSVGKVTLYASWKPVDYWKDALSRKCATANALYNQSGGVASSFVFITDVHVPSNALVSPYLVKQVLQRTAANMVVFGGDVINYHSNRQNAIDMIAYLPTAFGSTEFHFVRGNHDGNTYSSKAVPEDRITDVELIRMTAGKNEIREDGKLYYYRDDDAHRIRYIMCDSGVGKGERIDAVQVSWLKDRILELDEDWSVLVFVHRFYGDSKISRDGYTHVLDATGNALIDAFDEVYGRSRASIIGVLCGHCHRDFAERPSKKGYPYVAVSTTCDAYAKTEGDPRGERTLRTDDEQAFDVVTIDTSRKMLYLTRVGWGQDRSFSYAANGSASTSALTAGGMA